MCYYFLYWLIKFIPYLRIDSSLAKENMMSFKKEFKNKSEALIEADKILRLIHHYNGEYKHLIESSYLERLSDKIKMSKKNKESAIIEYFKKERDK